MSTERTAIELEIDVPGSVEEVWRSVATGPGISSWYVPHTLEERAGGAGVASFGPEPEMQVPGRVAVWEPPHRVVFDGGEGVGGLAFEWLVEPQGDNSCTVRLNNTGFGEGGEWDDQYDDMVKGWRLFMDEPEAALAALPRPRRLPASLPMGMWPGPGSQAWARLTEALGIPSAPAAGDRVEVTAADSPPLAGTVVDASAERLALLVDEPAPGTAFMAAEGTGETVMVSVWSYLYGDEGAACAAARRAPLEAVAQRPRRLNHSPAEAKPTRPPHNGGRLPVGGYVLGLAELVDALGGALAAQPGLLHAAEGSGRVRQDAAVEADHAGLDALAHTQALGQVLGEDVSHETHLGVVGRGDRGPSSDPGLGVHLARSPAAPAAHLRPPLQRRVPVPPPGRSGHRRTQGQR